MLTFFFLAPSRPLARAFLVIIGFDKHLLNRCFWALRVGSLLYWSFCVFVMAAQLALNSHGTWATWLTGWDMALSRRAAARGGVLKSISQSA